MWNSRVRDKIGIPSAQERLAHPERLEDRALEDLFQRLTRDSLNCCTQQQISTVVVDPSGARGRVRVLDARIQRNQLGSWHFATTNAGKLQANVTYIAQAARVRNQLPSNHTLRYPAQPWYEFPNGILQGCPPLLTQQHVGQRGELLCGRADAHPDRR